MNQHALYHEPKSKYAYAYDQNTLHIRLRTAKDDLLQVTVIAFDPYSYVPNENGEWYFDLSKRFQADMEKEHSDELFDYWFGSINQVDTLRVRYAFLLDNKMFYGPYLMCDMEKYDEISAIGNHYFNFPYINEEDIFQGPAWVKSTVWYQIFPERFHRSKEGPTVENMLPWNLNEVVTNEMVYGGNLHGVIEKLDYIKSLGITGVYFTPIFESPSTHKYDTSDYFAIDKDFGDNETLEILVKEAHNRGLKVMLDGVFNHCGFEHPFFQDVMKKGKKSKYYDCFYIEGDHINMTAEQIQGEPNMSVITGLNYRMFGTAPNMPKWRTSHPIVREHLINVGTYWIEKYDIDGWRLDVSNEVSHDFWRAFRKAVKQVKPDAYIIGENWDNSYPWLSGDQFDGVMNYELASIILNFIGVQDIREKYDVEKFVFELGKYQVNYPKSVVPFMFNMMDSHDTPRVLTACGDDVNKAKLVYLLQMIMPGAPSVMYGSEIGLKGNFESARGCMIFDQNHDLYAYLKNLIHLRKQHGVFQDESVNITWYDQLSNSIVIKKSTNSEILYVGINNSSEVQMIQINNQRVRIKPFDYHMILNDQTITC